MSDASNSHACGCTYLRARCTLLYLHRIVFFSLICRPAHSPLIHQLPKCSTPSSHEIGRSLRLYSACLCSRLSGAPTAVLQSLKKKVVGQNLMVESLIAHFLAIVVATKGKWPMASRCNVGTIVYCNCLTGGPLYKPLARFGCCKPSSHAHYA